MDKIWTKKLAALGVKAREPDGLRDCSNRLLAKHRRPTGSGDMREKLCGSLRPRTCYPGLSIEGLRPVRHWWHVPVC